MRPEERAKWLKPNKFNKRNNWRIKKIKKL